MDQTIRQSHETEPSFYQNWHNHLFTNNSLNENFWPLYIICKHLSWREFTFLLFLQLLQILMKRQRVKRDLKKGFINRPHLFFQANAYRFLPAILHKSEWVDQMLTLNQARSSFSILHILGQNIYI